MKLLGLFGGTFDPIHIAHLRMALELKQLCGIDDMRLLPAHIPPHRAQPHCSALQRADMLKLALSECPELSVDTRELDRDQPSYTVDTLSQLATEVADDVALCWCVGGDSLVNLPSWHRWQDLFALANLVVAVRPGYHLPESGPMAELIAQHQVNPEQLGQYRRGKIVIAPTSLLDISATGIRAEISAGRSAQFLLSEPVRRYIDRNNLYRKK